MNEFLLGMLIGNFLCTLWLAFKVGQHEESLKASNPQTPETE